MARDAASRRREETQALLHSQRAEYVKHCWGAAFGARTPNPPPMRLHVDFDASGREVARRARLVIPPQDPSSPEAKSLACAGGDKPPRLKTTPAGKPESIELFLSY